MANSTGVDFHLGGIGFNGRRFLRFLDHWLLLLHGGHLWRRLSIAVFIGFGLLLGRLIWLDDIGGYFQASLVHLIHRTRRNRIP